jgi:xanthine dehydrogenase small subunit
MKEKTLHFIRKGLAIRLDDVPADAMLLPVIRHHLGACGTKEGCGEGDCGACTVVIAEPEGEAGVRFRAINSCIRPAHAINGLALFTVEDLETPDGTLHPVQQAMVDTHGAQCGFCTPGFIMSLFGMYQRHVALGKSIDRRTAEVELAGNLCRCTGYRPIVDAACRLSEYSPAWLDARALRARMDELATRIGPQTAPDEKYLLPTNLDQALAWRQAYPDAQVLAGATDVGIWINKLHQEPQRILDVSRVRELRQLEETPTSLLIGASVPLSDAFEALVTIAPSLANFLDRFAGLPIRESATLGGNIANGSPIGDSMPLLIALNAEIHLQGPDGARSSPIERFYRGYRKPDLRPGEIITGVLVPKPQPGALLKAYKVSKRFDDDISAVCLTVMLNISEGRVHAVRIGAGGVAPTPMRAHLTEAALTGQDWTAQAASRAARTLQTEFSPISDLRASEAYRRQVLDGLMQRLWLESQGVACTVGKPPKMRPS